MDESYRIKMIEDLNELINIPEVDTYIFLTIEQAKIKFAEEIENYRQLKNSFHQAKRGNMTVVEDKNPPVPVDFPDLDVQSYYFELKRIKPKSGKLKYQWLISKVKPKPKESPSEVIPNEFINCVDFHQVDPDKIETYKHFKSRSLKKYFDIRFTRYSDTHVMGSIRENKKDMMGKEGTELFDDNCEAFKMNLGQTGIKEDYMELFRYMEEHPEIKEDIFSRFNMVQKPYVDNSKKLNSSK